MLLEAPPVDMRLAPNRVRESANDQPLQMHAQEERREALAVSGSASLETLAAGAQRPSRCY